MPTIIEKLAYTIDELEPKAKARAIDNWREHQLDYQWWDWTYEDATTVGKLIGINVHDIAFSGFYSQGDGACIKGELDVSQLKDAVTKLLTHVGPSCDDIIAIAKRGEALHDMIVVRLVELRLRGQDLEEDDLDLDEVLLHSCLEIVSNERYNSTKVHNCPGPVKISDALSTYVDDFAGWIYKQLEAEHDFQTGDEAVLDSIKSNEVLFDEDGVVI